MNAQQAENLRILIRHMEGITRVLDMDRFTNPCGTPACALGEAAIIPHFQRLGWEIGRNGLTFRDSMLFGVESVRLTFGEASDANLFCSSRRNPWNRTRVTPQEWAIEARKVLAENGYSMDEKPDAFAAFMEKVREPVALEVSESH